MNQRHKCHFSSIVVLTLGHMMHVSNSSIMSINYVWKFSKFNCRKKQTVIFLLSISESCFLITARQIISFYEIIITQTVRLCIGDNICFRMLILANHGKIFLTLLILVWLFLKINDVMFNQGNGNYKIFLTLIQNMYISTLDRNTE